MDRDIEATVDGLGPLDLDDEAASFNRASVIRFRAERDAAKAKLTQIRDACDNAHVLWLRENIRRILDQP